MEQQAGKYQKNEEFEVVIEDIGTAGEGIAKVNGYAIFVKDTVREDRCLIRLTKVTTHYAYGRVIKILKPGPERVEPVCPVAKQCGGCKIMAMSYDEQLRFKGEKIRNNIEKIGKVTGFEYFPVIGMEHPYEYRNKAQFPVGQDKEGNIITGFYAGRTHHIIPNHRCHIGIVENEKILDIIKGYMRDFSVRPYNEVTRTGVIRHVMIRKAFATGEIMVCIVVNGDKLKAEEELVKRLTNEPELTGIKSISISVNKENTNVILGRHIRLLYGQPYITDYIHDLQFRISPKSFFQVNPVQTDRLYSKALEFAGLTGNETVWDLYCGIGTISLFLARNAKKVYGVEIVEDAIRDAKENAKVNGITNAEFFVGKSEEVLPEFYKKNGGYADVIVVDPPRKGCDEKLLETIVAMQPKKMVYVSCDSATLARDLNYMSNHGYEVKKVQGVDMFPHTEHVESVCLLSKVQK